MCVMCPAPPCLLRRCWVPLGSGVAFCGVVGCLRGAGGPSHGGQGSSCSGCGQVAAMPFAGAGCLPGHPCADCAGRRAASSTWVTSPTSATAPATPGDVGTEVWPRCARPFHSRGSRTAEPLYAAVCITQCNCYISNKAIHTPSSNRLARHKGAAAENLGQPGQLCLSAHCASLTLAYPAVASTLAMYVLAGATKCDTATSCRKKDPVSACAHFPS
jgi:hypothetical protein